LPTEPLQITEPASRARPQRPAPQPGRLARDELKSTLAEAGLDRSAPQIWQLDLLARVTDSAHDHVAKKSAIGLNELFVIERPQIVTEQRSTDGTRKWLAAFPRRQEAETVNIPEEDRGSGRVSSQVGCTLTAASCHTGTQPLVRNLTPTRSWVSS